MSIQGRLLEAEACFNIEFGSHLMVVSVHRQSIFHMYHRGTVANMEEQSCSTGVPKWTLYWPAISKHSLHPYKSWSSSFTVFKCKTLTRYSTLVSRGTSDERQRGVELSNVWRCMPEGLLSRLPVASELVPCKYCGPLLWSEMSSCLRTSDAEKRIGSMHVLE